MTESIRGRLLKWHTATVAVVVAVLGATVAWLAWEARVADIDRRLEQRAGALAAALTPAVDATFDLAVPMGAQASDWQDVYYVIWNRDGALLDRSDPDIATARPGAIGVRSLAGRRELAVLAAAGSMVLVGRDLQDVRRDIGALAGTIVAAGLGVLALSLALGWVAAGRTLAPLGAINRTATRMAQGDLHARIPTDRLDTELDQMGRALNAAFDELQAAGDRQRRFTADASHELRTPLTTISTEVQWALGRNRAPDDYRSSLAVVKASADRIEAIVARLLALARAESAPMAIADVHLGDVVTQVVRNIRPLATRRDVTVVADVTPADVRMDPADLDAAVTNVVSNAVLYNVPGGHVSVKVERADDTVRLQVRDTGVGIAPEDQPRIFDPFFRTELARSRESSGAGLGLALTRAIVEHAGEYRNLREPARPRHLRDHRVPRHAVKALEITFPPMPPAFGAHALATLAVAALGGLAVGVERQWSGHAAGPRARFAGVRTFTLLGLVSGLCGWLWTAGLTGPSLVLMAGVGALVVVAYFSASRSDIDGTTEVAAFVVLAAGLAAGIGLTRVASGIIAVTLLLLVEKTRLHAWVRKLDRTEVRAGARFAVMAAVILPLLPQGPFGPAGTIRPQLLWALVLFFSGLSFFGYIARRSIGADRGYALAGALGGMVSSTSVTLTYSRLSQAHPEAALSLASGVLGANFMLFPRILLATAVLALPLANALWILFVAPALIAAALALRQLRAAQRQETPPRSQAESNPLQFKAALQMAALFQVVLFGVAAANAWFGQAGIYASAAVLGLADMDALTVSMAGLVTGGTAPLVAARAIAIGVIANTAVKLLIALVVGRGRFRILAAAGLAAVGLTLAAGLAFVR